MDEDLKDSWLGFPIYFIVGGYPPYTAPCVTVFRINL